MDIVVELVQELPGILAITFGGIVALAWFTDFFEILRDMVTNDPRRVRELEAQVEKLENELEAMRGLGPTGLLGINDSIEQAPTTSVLVSEEMQR